ncbi:MAG: hypothetical protein KBT04_03015 [Bacteroidales bacterium]|nr:hypothetical protein [Candidatus Colimorpha onthohippi]
MASRLGLTLSNWWQHRRWYLKIYDVLLRLFALAGVAIVGAWGIFQLGLTNNNGSVDRNYRYLISVDQMQQIDTDTLKADQLDMLWNEQYIRLAAFSKYYPTNAHLILNAMNHCGNPAVANRMLAAAEVYIDHNEEYRSLADKLLRTFRSKPSKPSPNVIPWMDTPEWESLKEAIRADSALINKAGRLCGVEPRLIVGCLVGEQIRLFNSKREIFKQYLGPLKVLSVQSQFSYGVNGIKEHTAIAVENNLYDSTSPYYMGQDYVHLLDFETGDQSSERYRRLVDYRNHLYSYLYTGCILHQTMLQWRRAGHNIENRPDILFTLFNVGFSQSVPKNDPVCGGSHITVNDKIYTFGAIGFDFYYSGELAETFPYWKNTFTDHPVQSITQEQVIEIQHNVSDCKRPEKGLDSPTPTTKPKDSPAVTVLQATEKTDRNEWTTW